MGRWAFVAVAVLLVVGVAAIPSGERDAQQGSARIAFVSSETILRQTPGFAKAESTFNAEMDSYKQEVQKLQKQLDSTMSAYNQQSVVLSPPARQQKMDELQQLQQRYSQRQQEINQRMQQRQQELMAPLEDRVQRVIDGLRAERNLTMIFDVSSPYNTVVSADPAVDLTQTVIGRLGSGGPSQKP